MSHRDLLVEDLRRSRRLTLERGLDVAVLWVEAGDEVIADVHDVSLGGLGVYLQNVDRFPVGQTIHLVHLGRYMHACVRHIEPQPDGDFIVGLSCKRDG